MPVDQRHELVGPLDAQALDDGVVVVARRRMHGDERRLVDHEQVLVFVQHASGGISPGSSKGSRQSSDAVALAHAIVRAQAPPVGIVGAGFDDGLRARAAGALSCDVHEDVEPLPGGFGRHREDAQDRSFGNAVRAVRLRVALGPAPCRRRFPWRAAPDHRG